MAERPLVSICIFNYNYGRFLGDAVRAALAQTYECIEVVVTDNASTDESMEVLAGFASDARLRIFRNAENIGWMRNHRRAIALAEGRYAVAIPADDVLLPTFCTNAVAFLECNRATTDAVYASVAYTDVTLTPHIAGQCQGLLPGSYTGGRNEFRELLRMDHIRWPVMLAARETLLRFADFDESLHAQADWAALLAMSLAGVRFGYIPETQALIRRHRDQRSSDGRFVNSVRELEDYLTIHERFAHGRYHAYFHGTEHTLRADFDRLRERIKRYDARSLTPVLEQRADDYAARLDTLIASPPPAHPHEKPRISVIVTTGGLRPAALLRALDSLQRQHERNFEVIVVQCGGESLAPWIATLPIAERTRFFHAAQELTTAAARNIGIRLSTGELLAYLDEDACFTPEHLSGAVHVLEATGAAAVCANTTLVIDGLRAENLLGVGPGKTGVEIAPMVPAAALVHRFACIEQVGAFAETLPVLDDWHLVLMLAGQVPVTASSAATVEIHLAGGFFGSAYARTGCESFFAILDMIYAAVAVPTTADAQTRTAYRQRLAAAWPLPSTGPDAMRLFMLALAGDPSAPGGSESVDVQQAGQHGG